MKNILLLDTSFAAMPIYKYLYDLGYNIWVMGNRKADALAVMAGEKWINQDYSKVEDVRRHIENLKIDFIVPGCTDLSIEVCLALDIEHKIFDSIDIYHQLGNKKAFRQICKKLNLPSPQEFSLKEFPCKTKVICKPTDAFSGRGVEVINGENKDKVFASYKNAQKESISSQAIIEEYIEGPLYSFSTFLEKNTIIKYFIVKEGSSVNPYAVDTSYVDNNFNKEVIAHLKKSIEKLSNYLKLKDGLLHTQFILKDDIPYLIELSRRSPGDLYSLLIEYSTGYNYAAKYASYFIMKDHKTSQTKKEFIIRHTIASNTPEYFLSLKFIHQIDM